MRSIDLLLPHLRKFKLLRDLCYFIDYLQIDMDTLWNDARFKFVDIEKLSEEAIKQSFIDRGMDYIYILLNILKRPDTKQMLALATVLQLYKGDLKGVDILGSLFNFSYTYEVWHEEKPLGVPNTAKLHVTMLNGQVLTEDFQLNFANFLRNYLYPTITVDISFKTYSAKVVSYGYARNQVNSSFTQIDIEPQGLRYEWRPYYLIWAGDTTTNKDYESKWSSETLNDYAYQTFWGNNNDTSSTLNYFYYTLGRLSFETVYTDDTFTTEAQYTVIEDVSELQVDNLPVGLYVLNSGTLSEPRYTRMFYVGIPVDQDYTVTYELHWHVHYVPANTNYFYAWKNINSDSIVYTLVDKPTTFTTLYDDNATLIEKTIVQYDSSTNSITCSDSLVYVRSQSDDYEDTPSSVENSEEET